MTNDAPTQVGRARTVLVYGQNTEAKAIVTDVAARIRHQVGSQPLTVVGPVHFESQLLEHLAGVVLGAVSEIAHTLLPKKKPDSFELSVTNPGASTALDLETTISGFSLDTAVFLALLSASLRMPIRQDVVTTGSLASAGGDIRAVRAIDAKLAAAIADPTLRKFLVPAIDADKSLQTLAPAECARAQTAMLEAKRNLRVVPVTDVSQLIRESFDDESVVVGSLKSGFFGPARGVDEPAGAIQSVVRFLSETNEERFWSVLEIHLLAGSGTAARNLLLLRARHHLRLRRYPQGLGLRLRQLLASVPPTTRRGKGLFPLLPEDICLRVCRLARRADYDDIQYLLQAASGNVSRQPHPPQLSKVETGCTASSAVDAMLEEISESSLAEKFGNAIDSARAAYVLPEITAATYEEFNDTTAAFYTALLRHTGSPLASATDEILRAKNLQLLERAFARRGELNGAWAEGRDGIHGGMRLVLDLVTEQFRKDLYAQHVRYVLVEAMDPLDGGQRLSFMKAFLERVGPQLPADIRSQPARRYTRHYETIVEAYVRSMDRVNQFLRTL